jgi:hypothetical protein
VSFFNKQTNSEGSHQPGPSREVIEKCRAARVLLGESVDQIAARAMQSENMHGRKISGNMIEDFEKGILSFPLWFYVAVYSAFQKEFPNFMSEGNSALERKSKDSSSPKELNDFDPAMPKAFPTVASLFDKSGCIVAPKKAVWEALIDARLSSEQRAAILIHRMACRACHNALSAERAEFESQARKWVLGDPDS